MFKSDKGRLFLVPVSPPVRSEGGEKYFFLNGRKIFLTDKCRDAAASVCKCYWMFKSDNSRTVVVSRNLHQNTSPMLLFLLGTDRL